MDYKDVPGSRNTCYDAVIMETCAYTSESTECTSLAGERCLKSGCCQEACVLYQTAWLLHLGSRFLLLCPGRQELMAQVLGPLHPREKTRSFRISAATSLGPGCCGHVWKKLVGGVKISLSLCLLNG